MSLLKLENGDIRLGDKVMPQNVQQVPLGTYNLTYIKTMSGGFFQLDKIEDLVIPKKLYGNFSIVDRVLHSFANTDSNIAVGLFGLKGGGKTITAKKIGIDSGLPVITINTPFIGAEFVELMSHPALDNCVFLIDEFEKLFDTKHHEDATEDDTSMLQILDGTRKNHKLFVLTSNNPYLGDLFTNRLGRVKYRQEYGPLSEAIVKEVAEDMLIKKEHLSSILKFHDVFLNTTYDVLVKLIEDVNLFDEDAVECSKYLNLEFDNQSYSLELISDKFELVRGYETITLDPYDDEFRISVPLKYQVTIDNEKLVRTTHFSDYAYKSDEGIIRDGRTMHIKKQFNDQILEFVLTPRANVVVKASPF